MPRYPDIIVRLGPPTDDLPSVITMVNQAMLAHGLSHDILGQFSLSAFVAPDYDALVDVIAQWVTIDGRPNA